MRVMCEVKKDYHSVRYVRAEQPTEPRGNLKLL